MFLELFIFSVVMCLLILYIAHLKNWCKYTKVSIILFTISILSLIWIALVFKVNEFNITGKGKIDINATSAAGSIIGAILSPSVSLISIILFLKALNYQRSELNKQVEIQNEDSINRANDLKVRIIEKCEKEIDKNLSTTHYYKINNSEPIFERSLEKILRLKNTKFNVTVGDVRSLHSKTTLIPELNLISLNLAILISSLNEIEGPIKKEYINFFLNKYYQLSNHIYDENFHFAVKYQENIKKAIDERYVNKANENKEKIKVFFSNHDYEKA